MVSAGEKEEIGWKTSFWAEFLREQGYAALLVDSFRPRKLEETCTAHTKLSSARARSCDAYGALAHLQRMAIVEGKRVALMGGSNGWRAYVMIVESVSTRLSLVALAP